MLALLPNFNASRVILHITFIALIEAVLNLSLFPRLSEAVCHRPYLLDIGVLPGELSLSSCIVLSRPAHPLISFIALLPAILVEIKKTDALLMDDDTYQALLKRVDDFLRAVSRFGPSQVGNAMLNPLSVDHIIASIIYQYANPATNLSPATGYGKQSWSLDINLRAACQISDRVTISHRVSHVDVIQVCKELSEDMYVLILKPIIF